MRLRAALAVLSVALAAGPLNAQRTTPVPAPARLQLTVDSIMRGPALVGAPPANLRWSVDSNQLYLTWRKPGEKEDALYVVARDGGVPKRLSDEEAKAAPPANGRWDPARRRLLAAQGGDIFIHDPSAPS